LIWDEDWRDGESSWTPTLAKAYQAATIVLAIHLDVDLEKRRRISRCVVL